VVLFYWWPGHNKAANTDGSVGAFRGTVVAPVLIRCHSRYDLSLVIIFTVICLTPVGDSKKITY
jgi:hypothetical protein